MGQGGGGGASNLDYANFFEKLGNDLHVNTNATTQMVLDSSLKQREQDRAQNQWEMQKKLLMQQYIKNQRDLQWQRDFQNAFSS